MVSEMLFPCLAPAGGSEAPLWSLAVRLKPVVSCHFCGHDSAPYRSIRSLCFRSLLSLWQHFLFWLEYCLNSNISAAPSAATPLEMVFHAFITPRVQLSGEWLLTTRRLPSKVGISLMVPFFFAEAALLFFPPRSLHLCWSQTPRADFGSGLTNQTPSSAVNRKRGLDAVLRKTFGWGEALWSFFPHIVVESWASPRGLH